MVFTSYSECETGLKEAKIVQSLTNVAKLGSREFDPLRLPVSIGGLGVSTEVRFFSSSWRMIELSGVSSILQFY